MNASELDKIMDGIDMVAKRTTETHKVLKDGLQDLIDLIDKFQRGELK